LTCPANGLPFQDPEGMGRMKPEEENGSGTLVQGKISKEVYAQTSGDVEIFPKRKFALTGCVGGDDAAQVMRLGKGALAR